MWLEWASWLRQKLMSRRNILGSVRWALVLLVVPVSIITILVFSVIPASAPVSLGYDQLYAEQQIFDEDIPIQSNLETVDVKSSVFSTQEISRVSQLVNFHREPRDVEDPTREAAWFRSRIHPIHESIFVLSITSGSFELFVNMVCSLYRSNASHLLDHMVVWALDENVGRELVGLRRQIKERQFLLGGHGNVGSVGRRQLFGVFYDGRSKAVNPAHSSKKSVFLYLMGLRGEFFHRLAGVLNVSFVFSDADVYFQSDPFVALNLPFGIPEKQVHRVEKETKILSEQKSYDIERLYDSIPDMVYSTDARKPYHVLPDPYEDKPLMPELCGGFFFARANHRVATVFKAIRDGRLNDQWDLINMLNFRSSLKFLEPVWSFLTGERVKGLNSVIINPLPAGLKTRKPWHPLSLSRSMHQAVGGGWVVSAKDAEGILRMRLLSQAAYGNSFGEFAQPGTRGPGFYKFILELKERGEYEVLYHPNGGDYNKTWVFDMLDMWKIVRENDSFKCIM